MARTSARLRTVLGLVVAVLVLGAALDRLTSRGNVEAGAVAGDPTFPGNAPGDAARPAARSEGAEIARRFGEGVALLHTRRYDAAAVAFHQVLRLAPRMPEAHVNMGYALVGQGRHGAAKDFFEAAIALRPRQANAYYGLALVLEQEADLRGALGAMRAFVHLAPPQVPQVRRARAAIWEWQAALEGEPLPREAPASSTDVDIPRS